MPQIYFVFIVVLMELIGLGMIIPLSPYKAREFLADDLQVGLLMSVYSLIQCISSPLLGKLSDVIGRKPILLLGLFFTSLSYLWFALASDLTGLFLSRVLAGAFGVSVSTSFAYISDQSSTQNRSKNMGLIGAAFGLGFVIGPALAGLLGRAQSSQVALGASLIVFIGFLLALFFVKESHRKVSSPSPSRFIFSQIFSYQILKSSPLKKVLLIFFISSLSLTLVEAPLFLIMKDRFDWSLKMSSFGFAYIGLILAFTQGFLVRVGIPYLGEKKTNLIGFGFLSLGLMSLCLNQIGLVGLGVTAMSLGFGLCYVCLTSGVSLLSQKGNQGGTMGVHQSFSSLSRILGPALGGWLYRDLSHNAPFIVAGSLAGLGFCLSYFFRKSIPNAGKLGKTEKINSKENIKINQTQLKNLLERGIPFSFFYLTDTLSQNKEDTFFQNPSLKSILNRVQKIDLKQLDGMEFSSPVVLICKNGILSQNQAFKMFDRWKNVFYVEGGVEKYLKSVE